MPGHTRVPFTRKHEVYLARYIAKYNPEEAGRQGNKLYETLCENADGRWPFSKHHTWQSWREHYKNNRATIDPLINKYIKIYHGDAVAASQPTASSSMRSDSDARVQYTREDDDLLTEYLATHLAADKSFLGQRFWMGLSEDADDHPWVKRHSWQSWRERYKKNQQYFDWAVGRRLGEDVSEDPPVPRPKTSDDFLVKKPAAKARTSERQSMAPTKSISRRSDIPASGPSAASSEQRKRVRPSDAGVQERPAKKGRAQGEAEAMDNWNVASSSKVVAAETPADVDQVPAAIEESGQREGSVDVDVVQDEVNADEGESSDVGSEGDAPIEPPGSDDYNGQIFSSPSVAVDEVEKDVADIVSVTSGSADEEDELDQLLGEEDNVVEQVSGEADGLREGVNANQTVHEEAHASELLVDDPSNLSQADASHPPAPHHMASCTEAHVPPARKHNTRIRETEVPLLTPELSPTQEALARHQEQQPFTAPRRHVRRIQTRQEDNIFGTPSSATRSPSLDRGGATKEPSSPAAEAEARHHGHGHSPKQDVSKVRQPPRLDEGAFNKAFSDAHGRPRVSPSGKPRRQSGVDFEADEVVDQQDDHDEDLNEEHVSELAQWPPVRKRKSSGKGKAPASPSTPSPTRTPRGKGHSRTVTTKEFVSVTTMRTVERRLGRPRQPKGTPFPRGAIADASEPEDQDDAMDATQSPASPPRQDEDSDPAAVDEVDMDVDEKQVDEDAWPSPSQHHPFSQPRHPFSQPSHPFSQVDELPSRQNNIPISNQDISLIQRLLHPRSTEDAHSNQAPSGSNRTKNLPLSEADRMRLDSILQMEGKRAFPEPSKQDRHLPEPASMGSTGAGASTTLGAGTSGARQTSFQRSGTSPLAGRGDRRPTSAERLGKIIPPVPSGSRVDPAAQLPDRVDKGKSRADAIEGEALSRRYTVGGYASSDVFYQPERPASRHRAKRPRQSHSPAFALGEEGLLANRTALSLAFHPPPFDVLRPRSAPIPSTTALSRSVTPAKSANTSLVDILVPRELEMVKELGMNTAIHIMARNHGFSEDTVRELYIRTGSLEVTDNVLRKMREGANEKASKELSSIMGDDGDADGDEDEDEAGGDEHEEGDGDFDEREGHAGEEAEVERELTQPPTWIRDGPSFDFEDEAPLAESSRFDASHIQNSRGPSSHRRQQLRIQPLPGDVSASVGMEYSPPKHTRAAQYVKRARESLGQSHRGSDAAAISPDASTPSSARGDDVTFGKLARLNQSEWQRLEEAHGKGSAKVVAGKALARLLKR